LADRSAASPNETGGIVKGLRLSGHTVFSLLL
jgi:hypothetical protein